jgi:hypothetical protein
MTGETILTVPQREDPQRELERHLMAEWSRNLRVGRLNQINAYEREAIIQVQHVNLIYDTRSRSRIFSQHVIPDVAKFTIKASPKEWTIRGPSKQEVIASMRRSQTTTLARSERTLLHTAYSRLVGIPVVQTAFSPLRNILVFLDDRGEIPIASLQRTGKSPERVENYLSLLERLKYTKREGKKIVPGPKFPTEAASREMTDIFDGILANVLEQEYPFILQVLRWTQIVGYLRWLNSYYLTSLLAETRINLPIPDLDWRYCEYYGCGHRSELERRGQLQRVLDTRIIVRRGGGVEGDEEITTRFFENARHDGLVPLAV